MDINGKLEVASWQEDELDKVDAAEGKTTAATIGYTLSGGLEGTAVSNVAMHYLADGTAAVVGLLRVTGTAGDKTGGIVFRTVGGYDGTTATGDLTVIDGSGTGDFQGVIGTGSTSATSDEALFSFDLDL